MPLRICQGDLFDSGADVLVNPVNCRGVMGKGLALQFKKRFPGVFKHYKLWCLDRHLKPGQVMVVQRSAEDEAGPEFVVNFATKDHWRGRSRYEDIEKGLRELRAVLNELRPRAVAIPPLGCGLGGLDWERVQPLIEAALADCEAQILLYAPVTSCGGTDTGTEPSSPSGPDGS